jgi:uncharacterized protein YqgC (DUF456 family)
MTIGSYYIEIEQIARGVALTFMLLGLLVIPILPGLVIIWAAALGYGIFGGFGTLGWVMFALISVLAVVGSVLDNVLMGTQAHKEGAPWWAVLVALLAAVVGSFLIPIPIVGGIIAALGTLFLIEWARIKDAKKAFSSMKGMMVGCGWAAVFRFIMGLVMIGLWLIWAWA